MGQLSLEINGRTYAMGCEKGDEARLMTLAAYVREKLEGLVSEHGQAGEARLLLMTALLLADELFDERAGLENGAPIARGRVKADAGLSKE